ncbi:MAG: addiction module antidote protein [Rhodanobacteraceae bacterium]
MTKAKTKPWNVQDHLKTEEECRLFLEAAFEDAGEDPAYLAQAIGEVARAQGMTRVARKAGLAREALYRSLSRDGNPELGTVLKVLHAFGLQLTTKKLAA